MKKTLAELRSLGFEIAWNSNNFFEDVGSISTGESMQSVNADDLTNIIEFEVINDTSGKDLKIHINGNPNKFLTIKGDESRVFNSLEGITSLQVSNVSGSTINYRIAMWGF